jgi:hypothetical protein
MRDKSESPHSGLMAGSCFFQTLRKIDYFFSLVVAGVE